ncbi:MAG: DUF4357 domain-containing protein [Oscillospiraceae bacterium]|nr:DUF4357 domain-containing protein [Oscillospiraceae bacterium]
MGQVHSNTRKLVCQAVFQKASYGRRCVTSRNRTDCEDVLFKSPSYAVCFVIGGHANGMTEWKMADGRT